MFKTQYHKKLAGTSLLAVIILGLVLVFTGQVQAFITYIGNDVHFTGTVTQVNPNSIQVDKGGTFPFVVVTDGSTGYNGTYSQLGDVAVGDAVLVHATDSQGMLLAQAIEPTSAGTYGYGSGCEVFIGQDLTVSSVEQDRMYLSRGGITFYVDYNANTSVMPGNQTIADLVVGETVTVTGDDCHGDGLLADTIIRDVMPPTGNVACEDYTGFGLHNSQYLLSHDAGGAFTPRFPTSVPAGTYDVYGVSFDDHSQNAWDTFTNEAWYIEGFSGGTLAYTSNPTNDLPDGIDRNATQIGAGVSLASDLDEIRFIHNAYVDANYQSILPECVVFVPTR